MIDAMKIDVEQITVSSLSTLRCPACAPSKELMDAEADIVG
jgi:hypothetical protein